MANGQFYTVATPIGNLGDISKRAIETLNSADIIACEDKRVSAVLLNSLGISKPLMVYQKHNEQEGAQKILQYILDGKTVVLISDAGVPCISDPGKIIVKKLFENGIKTTNIPGACAITTLLASAPKTDEKFAFFGFLPRTKNEQEAAFEQFKNIDLAFYESPNRLIETLENIIEFRGKNQLVTIGRELTKKFEEIKSDSAENILNYYKTNTLKGEIAGILYASKDDNKSDFSGEIKALLKEGFSAKDTAAAISALFGVNKKEIYKTATALQKMK